MEPLDALAFGPHPDDVEIVMGGTLLKLASQGYRCGICDLTAGEMGTRGDRETRAEEALEAAKRLEVVVRRCLDLGDSRLEPNRENKLAVARVIRELRPKIVFTNYWEASHPDHAHSAELVREGAYLAGLKRLDMEGAPHRPSRILYYMLPHRVAPSFIVDVTKEYEGKLQAMQAYRSQFYDAASTEPETPLSQPRFMWRVESAHRYYGSLIDADYGEAFLVREAMRVDDLVGFFDQSFTRIT